jgi:hypothetical protein
MAKSLYMMFKMQLGLERRREGLRRSGNVSNR